MPRKRFVCTEGVEPKDARKIERLSIYFSVVVPVASAASKQIIADDIPWLILQFETRGLPEKMKELHLSDFLRRIVATLLVFELHSRRFGVDQLIQHESGLSCMLRAWSAMNVGIVKREERRVRGSIYLEGRSG